MDISLNVDENLKMYKEYFKNCDDVKIREMMLGRGRRRKAFITYIEVTAMNLTMRDSVAGKMINELYDMDYDAQYEYIKNNAMGITDITQYTTIEDAGLGMMTGDMIFFMDGYDRAIKIQGKGYPNLGVGKADNEKVIRGSREAFTESEKANTALMRKRLRTNELKVEEIMCGRRSNTNVAFVYMDTIVRDDVLADMKKRVSEFDIDGVVDSGIIEELTKDKIQSPFPTMQSTERPDRAAMAVLDGRVVILVDNSPQALIFPAVLSNMMQAQDDYYNNYHIASFVKALRYIAAFIAMALPGLYIALINYNTGILPVSFILSIAASRSGVPFSTFAEVIMMELAFELIREAGIRMPGPVSGTIGIVGGLIIGQAAVTANLVSPVVVILVALTALSSFAVPDEEFSEALRIVKYFVIILSASLGIGGFILSLALIAFHLITLKSFGFRYTGRIDITRPPVYKNRFRSEFAVDSNKRRLRMKKGKM